MLYLDFYHHTILIRCNESSLLQKLRDEFHYFIAPATSQTETVIDLNLASPPEIPSLVAEKILETCVVYRLGTRKYVDYFGEALTIHDRSEKRAEIYSLNENRLYELSFLAIHSFLGQLLESDGLARIHALGISVKDVNGVVMLPSKGGKSTLLSHVIRNPEVKIISDDMPLCDLHGQIHSFPSKISLSEKPEEGSLSTLTWNQFLREHYPPKWTASLSQLEERIERKPEENQTVLIAGLRLSSGQSIISEVPRWKMIPPLLEHMVIGLGLPQVIELFLRFDLLDLLKLTRHFFIRSWCAFKLVRKCRCYYFYMGPDKSYNAQLLLDLLYEHQTS